MNLTIDVFQGIEPWVFTNGGQVLNGAWTSVIIDNPAAVEACAFARSLVAKKLPRPRAGRSTSSAPSARVIWR